MDRPRIVETYYLNLEDVLSAPVAGATIKDALAAHLLARWQREALAAGESADYVAQYEFSYINVRFDDERWASDFEVEVALLRRDAWKDAAMYYGGQIGERTKSPPRWVGEFERVSIAGYHPAGKWEAMPEEDRTEAERLFYEGWEEKNAERRGSQ
jgi:hypothetical protein